MLVLKSNGLCIGAGSFSGLQHVGGQRTCLSKVTDYVSVQGVLADYNMLVDKLNTDTERAEVEMECVEVKAANEQTSQVSIITNEDLDR